MRNTKLHCKCIYNSQKRLIPTDSYVMNAIGMIIVAPHGIMEPTNFSQSRGSHSSVISIEMLVSSNAPIAQIFPHSVMYCVYLEKCMFIHNRMVVLVHRVQSKLRRTEHMFNKNRYPHILLTCGILYGNNLHIRMYRFMHFCMYVCMYRT